MKDRSSLLSSAKETIIIISITSQRQHTGTEEEGQDHEDEELGFVNRDNL